MGKPSVAPERSGVMDATRLYGDDEDDRLETVARLSRLLWIGLEGAATLEDVQGRRRARPIIQADLEPLCALAEDLDLYIQYLEEDRALRQQVLPVAPAVVSHVRGPSPQTRCPVCGERNAGGGWSCDACGVEMHEPCYWGRVAPMSEWLDYMRFIHDAPPEADPDERCRCVCSACRAKGGA